MSTLRYSILLLQVLKKAATSCFTITSEYCKFLEFLASATECQLKLPCHNLRCETIHCAWPQSGFKLCSLREQLLLPIDCSNLLIVVFFFFILLAGMGVNGPPAIFLKGNSVEDLCY